MLLEIRFLEDEMMDNREVKRRIAMETRIDPLTRFPELQQASMACAYVKASIGRPASVISSNTSIAAFKCVCVEGGSVVIRSSSSFDKHRVHPRRMDRRLSFDIMPHVVHTT